MAETLVKQERTGTDPHPIRNLTDEIFRRFNSEMQQGGINGMAERAVDKGGGVKGLSPEAMRAQRTPLRPPALSTTLSQAVYAGSQVKTILAWDFHISPEDTCPKAIVT